MRGRDIALSVLIVFALLFGLIGIWTVLYQDRVAHFTEMCYAENGHTYTVENRTFCISEDGRWIEIDT
jgi:hypothetical protein